MKKCLYSFIALLTIISCKSISVNQQPQLVTETPVELGAIGIVHDNMLHKSFESVAIPSFKKELKLYVQPVSFSKQTFKAFQKANTLHKKVNLTYEDSLQSKPQYVYLQFLDRVSITDQLNNKTNVGLRSYLETKERAQLVTSIAIAFSEKELKKISAADEVFLIQSATKKFSLELKSLDGKKEQLEFNNGVVFAYQLSGFCWKENDRHKLIIGDIVSNAESCPANTYKKASKATQKENYFKL
ncbi:hypothetical protein [Kordia sp.]|uniref:hypothetical protein n=1 Tax=Kordia sp. TaxID=1965332 RepID=UPI003D268266